MKHLGALVEHTDVAKSKAYEAVIRQIEVLIKSNNMSAGAILPSERKLAEQFLVSRHSVREAVRVLEQRGILETRHGSGTYLRKDSDQTTELMALEPTKTHNLQRLQEIFQLREILEPQIAGLAAHAIMPHQLKELKELIQEQELSDDATRLKQLDMRFHSLLAESTGNRVLFDLVKDINNTLESTRTESFQTLERRAVSVLGHKRILVTMEKHDPQAAIQEMHQHISSIKAIATKSSEQ